VIGYASRFLSHNPRKIKRFVNRFRFYTMIYAERKLANPPRAGLAARGGQAAWVDRRPGSARLSVGAGRVIHPDGVNRVGPVR
jgi:hypothetical protein